MRRYTARIVLAAAALTFGGLSPASAADKAEPATMQVREKFARLLLPEGPPKPAVKPRRGVVINAFIAGGPPATPVNPGRPGNRP